ncbi:MAG: TSUP family transporter [Hyphomicrobiaceae bacterium]
MAADAAFANGLLLVVAAVAGIVRGFAGFGGPMVILPVATAVLGPAAAVWVVLCADILVNVRLLPEVRGIARRAVVVPLAIGSLLTLPIGSLALVSLDAEMVRRVICSAILVASLVMLSGWRWRAELAPGQWVAVGALTGLVMGLTSLAVTAALFLQSGKTSAAEARADFIVWVFITSLALLAILTVQGGFPHGQAGAFLMVAPAYFAGTLAGARLHGRVSDATGRRVVLVLVAGIASIGLLR